MEKKSFTEAVAEVASPGDEAHKTRPQTAVEKAPTRKVARPVDPMDDFEGELNRSDIKIPKLNLVQSVGPLCDDFPRGSWVLNRSAILAPLGEAIHITPLRAKKYYVEALAYGSEDMPRMFDTLADAQDAGLRTDFDPETGDKPEINTALDVTVLVRAPEKLTAPEFSLEFDGQAYALALWSLASWSSYQNGAKVLLTARMMYLKSFHQREWLLHSEKTKLKNGNTTFIPKLVGGVAHTEAFKNWADSLVG